MWFSNQLPVMLGGQPGQKRGFAGDRRPELPPPLLVVGLRRRGIELAERVVVVVELPPMVGQDRRDLGPLAAVDERPGSHPRGEDPGGPGSSPRTRPPGAACCRSARATPGLSALWPSTAQSIPVMVPTSRRFSAGRPAWTSATTISAPRARSDCTDSRAASAGSRTTMPSARQRLASAAVGGARHAEDADVGPGGVEQAIGGETDAGRSVRRGWPKRRGA